MRTARPIQGRANLRTIGQPAAADPHTLGRASSFGVAVSPGGERIMPLDLLPAWAAAAVVLAAVLAGLRPLPATARRGRRPASAARPASSVAMVSADPRFGVVSTALYTAVVMVPGSSAGEHR
jgi:hypothetical protein